MGVLHLHINTEISRLSTIYRLYLINQQLSSIKFIYKITHTVTCLKAIQKLFYIKGIKFHFNNLPFKIEIVPRWVLGLYVQNVVWKILGWCLHIRDFIIPYHLWKKPLFLFSITSSMSLERQVTIEISILNVTIYTLQYHPLANAKTSTMRAVCIKATNYKVKASVPLVQST